LHNSNNGASAGHVRVFENIEGSWKQVGSDIDGEATFDYSGESVSLSADGSVVAIGAIFNADNGYDAINTKSCSEYDKILLDHLFNMMDL